MTDSKNIKILLVLVLAGMVFLLSGRARAAVQDEISQRNQQIEELQRQIEEYQNQVDSARTKSSTLESEIARLNAEINQVQLEIRALNLSINKTTAEVRETEGQISDTEQQMAKHRNALAQYIKLAYENDQRSLTEILLNNESISDFFNELNNLSATQDNLQLTIKDMKELKIQLETHQNQLEEQQTELERAKRLQDIEKRSLDSTKAGQSKLLKDTKGQESKYQELVKKSQKDIEAIRAQIQFLIQGGLTAEDAVRYAQLAAIGAGIRPAFLLALLETESRLGKNVGTGNWRDDMYLCYQRLATYYSSKRQYYLNRAETEKAAFFSIVNKLGLDPDTVKVSREPSYGCGGAMGPAQFIPSTWLGYEAEVIRITGHNPPNPWNFQDAFTASATKLARGGATSKDRAGEIRAAKAYISGNGSCASVTCNSYANGIQRLAAEIAKNL